MRSNSTLLAFNRGLMAKNALARVDLKRTALSAEVLTNWLPRAFGSMSLRPGTEYLGRTDADKSAILLPFVFSTVDTALLELTDATLRIWQDGAQVTAPAVSTSISNGGFATDLTDWTDADGAGGVSDFVAGGMGLTGDGTDAAARYQTVTVASGDQNVRHTLKISTSRVAGDCEVQVGTTTAGYELAGPITLRPGDHVISFTPTAGTIYVRFSNRSDRTAVVDSVSIAAAGAIEVPTPWAEADLPNVRWAQSGDVIFACDGAHRQQRIERWGAASWSVVDYRPQNGPFFATNTSDTTITSSSYGTAPSDVTLEASTPMFTPDHVGALFRLERTGQTVSDNVTGEDQWSGSIRVTGVEASRIFTVSITGKDGGDTSTVTLQRSLGAEGDWFAVATYTANTTVAFDDGLDNNIAYYRIGVVAGDFDTDTFEVSLIYAAGISTDVIRVTEYSSTTAVRGVVEDSLGGFGGTATWWEGRWSPRQGWPSAVALHEGRLWWAGGDHIDGSVSDAYDVFDDAIEGDSGPISRNLAVGPVDTAAWLIALDRLLVGTQGAEIQAKSSSLDEPLTPSAFGLKVVSTQGSARVPPVQIDTSAVFVQRTGKRIYEVSPTDTGYTYASADMMVVVPGLGNTGIERIAVQRQPDTRVYCVRGDGTLAVVIYDKAEDVRCWLEYETDGEFEDIAVLPSSDGDDVFAIVKRTIGGVDYRYVERFYELADGTSPTLNRLADSHVYTAGPVSSVSGLDHLEGETVCLWGDGKDLGTDVVVSGSVALPESASNVMAGLPYTARFKSARLVLSDRAGDHPFPPAKIISGLALILADTHAQGLRYGQSFDYLDDMPLKEGYALVDPDAIHADYEEQSFSVNGTWTPDARLCLEAASPRPCTVVAAVLDVAGNAK